MKQGSGKYILWFLVGIAFTYGQIWMREYLYPTPRSALPSSAANIEVNSWDEGFLPDHTYSLKAEISEEQFKDYVTRLGYQYSGSNAYTLKNGDYEEKISYSDGTVHFHSFSH